MKRFLHLVALYAFHIGFVRPLANLVLGTRYRRRDRLPDGSCIVVSNHNSHLDAGLLMSMFPLRRLHRVHPVAAADYFSQNLLRKTMAMALMNAVPIERKAAPGVDPLEPAARALRGGGSLILFPEGSRGEAGVLAKFRPGIARLAHAFPDVGILPVFLSGPERIWPRGRIVPVPIQTEVHIGRPKIYPQELGIRQITKSIRDDVAALAPPAPTLPGPRDEGPLRIAVCAGPDGVRHEVVRAITAALGPRGRAIGLTEPVVQADGEGERVTTVGIPFAGGRLWSASLAWLLRTRGPFRPAAFGRYVERSRMTEGLRHRRQAAFVVSDGSTLVDVAAWNLARGHRGAPVERDVRQVLRYLAGGHPIPWTRWPAFVRYAPELWLLNAFDLARPPLPDLVVLARSEDGVPAVRDAYDAVCEVLRRRHGARVVTFDPASPTAAAEVAERVGNALDGSVEEADGDNGAGAGRSAGDAGSRA